MTKAQVKEIGDQRCILLVTHSVYKVTRSLSWRDHLHEEFSCNSTHQIVSVRDLGIRIAQFLMAIGLCKDFGNGSLLRTFPGRAEGGSFSVKVFFQLLL